MGKPNPKMMNKEVYWMNYVKEQADEFGISFEEAWTIFEMLGESEAFDGFVAALEDYVESE